MKRSERIALLRDVLARHPALAQAAGRLPAYDQFKLTVELLLGSDWVRQEAVDGIPTNKQAVHDNHWQARGHSRLRIRPCAAQCRGFSRRSRRRSR